jgi:hypothetical protein
MFILGEILSLERMIVDGLFGVLFHQIESAIDCRLVLIIATITSIDNWT